jgi:hypothetical protein
MSSDSSETILERLQGAIHSKNVIPFFTERPDNYSPGVFWSIYGLVDTNEIVVVARHGDRKFATAGPSPLLYPAMIDRLFGMDVDDQAYAQELSHQLWPTVEKYLKEIQ